MFLSFMLAAVLFVLLSIGVGGEREAEKIMPFTSFRNRQKLGIYDLINQIRCKLGADTRDVFHPKT